jgi:hypothetical protein
VVRLRAFVLTGPRRTSVGSLMRAFTLVTGLFAVIVLGSRWIGVEDRAQAIEARRTLDELRVAIERFKQTQAGDGWPRPPTYVELQIPGVVLQRGVPVNPLNGSNRIVPVADATDPPRAVVDAGWCYDEAQGHVWSASSTLGANRW